MKTTIFRIISLLWMAIVAILSLMPADRLPKISWDLLAPDKVAHFIIYTLMSLFLIIALSSPQSNKAAGNMGSMATVGLRGAVTAALYGCLIEILQGTLTPNRHFDPADIVANSLGCVVGVAVYRLFLSRK